METGDQTLLAESDFHIGSMWMAAGQLHDAEQHLRKSCSLHEALGNEATLSYNLCWYAWTLILLDRAEEAVAPARRGHELSRRDCGATEFTAPFTAAVLALTGDHEGAARLLEELRRDGRQGALSWAPGAALEIGRIDLAIDEIRVGLTRGFGSALRDTGICAVVTALFERLEEHDLMAIWAAVTLGRDRSLINRDTYSANLADLESRESLGPLMDLEALVETARERLGPRFDELIGYYETSGDLGPVRETIRVLDGHAARLAGQP